MKRNLLSFATILLFVATSFIQCSKKESVPDPVANFSYSTVGSNTHAPATVSFSNSSANGASFSWDFGDGGSSSQRDASHKYTAAGTYMVKLTATAGSKNNVRTQSISIQAPYTKIALTKITLNSTTETSAYTAYFRFSDISNNELWKSANVTITPSALPASWSLSAPVVFNNLSAAYYIEVWKVGTISDTKVASGPLAPSLYNLGTDIFNSYPVSIPSLQGLSFTVQWQ